MGMVDTEEEEAKLANMKKSRHHHFINTIDDCMTNAVKKGIFHLSTEDEQLDGRSIIIENKKLINFGSCSYLGLEVDDRLKKGIIGAAIKYGAQFSASRLFVSCGLYKEAEGLLEKIFGLPTLLAPTTTLGHLGTLPVIIRDDDCIILDHQVHGSVQNTVQSLIPRGVHVEMVKHNDIDAVEEILVSKRNKYNRIWYMIDGVYSMYGDYPPMKEILRLLNNYPEFHLYADDAHAMSWAGENGKGYVLNEIPYHPKMVVTTSLCKAFGAGGAAIVFPNEEMKRRVRTCGSSFTFSGPVQPPMLGAIVESAKIHLTEEINRRQAELQDKVNYCINLIKEYNLPLVHESNSPIQYLGLGLPRVGYNMVRKLMKEGYYINIGIFPGVPIRCTGIRLAITTHQTKEDIKNVVEAINKYYPIVLKEEQQSIQNISDNFGLEFKDPFKISIDSFSNNNIGLKVEHHRSIQQVNKEEWDCLLGDNGSFDWTGMDFLEQTFTNNPDKENNWNFHYYIIRDSRNNPILATFITELITKDDMLSPPSISEKIEVERQSDKYYLSSRVMMMGSLLSEGEHAYINRDHKYWKEAFLTLFEEVKKEQDKCGASAIHLRDFDTNDKELSNFFHEQGFVRVDMPDNHELNIQNWTTEEEFVQQLSAKSRRHIRGEVLKYKDLYKVDIYENYDKLSPEVLERWCQLYRNVKNRSLHLNTYDLPKKLFANCSSLTNWEVLDLKIKDESTGEHKTIAVVFCYKSQNNYCPGVIGLDYDYLYTHKVYRQALYRIIERAKELNLKKVYFGMEASTEKKKLGVNILSESLYVQAKENFSAEVINRIYSNDGTMRVLQGKVVV